MATAPGVDLVSPSPGGLAPGRAAWRGHRRDRAAADRRAAEVCAAAVQLGLAHTCPLVHALAFLTVGAMALPHAGQEELGRRIHRHRGTVYRQARALEAAGLLRVYVAPPTKGRDGRYTRACNRYLLKDQRARQVLVTPSARQRRVTPSGSTQAGPKAPPPGAKESARRAAQAADARAAAESLPRPAGPPADGTLTEPERAALLAVLAGSGPLAARRAAARALRLPPPS